MHSRLNWNLEVLVFMKGEKPDSLEENFSKQRKNQQQTQTTYGINTRIQTQATLVGGKCSHRCVILVPPYWYYVNISSRPSAILGVVGGGTMQVFSVNFKYRCLTLGGVGHVPVGI